MRRATILSGLISFVAVGAVAFAAVASTRPDSSASGSSPADAASGTPEQVTVVAAQPFAGDPASAARHLVDEQIAREDGSSSGADDGTGLAVADEAAPGTPASADSGDGDGSATDGDPRDVPTSPGDGSLPAEEPLIDLCAGDAPPDYCPDGVGGTVELAIDALPPFDGMMSIDPAAPGTAPFPYYPECEPIDLAPGQIQVGLTVNRPAAVEIHTFTDTDGTWRRRTSTLSTEGAEDVWNAWATSDTSTVTDPEQWIRICAVLTDLEPGEYQVQATFTDRNDTTQQFTYPRDVPLLADVADASGDLPGQVRRPTIVFPVGVDRILVNAVRPADQWIESRAVPASGEHPGLETPCLAEYAQPSVAFRDGIYTGLPLLQSEIAESIRSAPGYRYLPDDSVSVTHEFALEEGTDYTLCLYWMDPRGTASDGRAAQIEAIPVSVAEAYRVSVDVVGIYDDSRALQSAGITSGTIQALRPSAPHPGSADECDALLSFGVMEGDALWPSSDRNLCTDMTGAAEMMRYGIPIKVYLEGGDGSRYYGLSRVRVDPRCPGTCGPRATEMAVVPLPDVGSGTPGHVALQLSFSNSAGNGASGFHRGTARRGDTGTGAPDLPYVEISTVKEDAGWGLMLRNGVDETVRVALYADAPMNLHMHVLPARPGDDLCHVGSSPAPRTRAVDPAGGRWAETLAGLCAGSSYRVMVLDDAGNPVPVWGSMGWDTTDGHDFSIDPIRVPVHGSVSGARNHGYSEGQTAYSNLWVTSPDVPAGHLQPLASAMSPALIERAATGGWDFTDDAYSACGNGLSASYYSKKFSGEIVVSHGHPILVEGFGTFRLNTRDADGSWTCTPTTGPGYLGNNVWTLRASADISVEDLLAGVAVRQEEGFVEGETWVEVQLRAG